MLPTKSPGSIRFDTLDRSPDDEISDVIDQHEIQAQKILDRRERTERILSSSYPLPKPYEKELPPRIGIP